MKIKITVTSDCKKSVYPKKKAVERVMETEIIRPSTSLYASPIVLVPKQNRESLICVEGVLQTLVGELLRSDVRLLPNIDLRGI